MQAREQRANPYAVLGVEPSASAELITSAFRARVRELRPDTRVDAATAARFGEVREAYETLRDPVLRAAYDHSCESAHDRVRAPAPTVRPARRHVVLLGAARPEPPLRAGPVRWERTAR
ncbi:MULTISPECIES: J domain-containing protein [Streptomyces]|uniref:Chaperone protein DnaJ n=1 Tax=Streptomyces chartreusis NRRL 3882 TaxID=1079985 RepID=A0A2N9BLL5_STRCX|nr:MULTISPECIES: J domain-containing protein [Streptomyces]MYS88613.1 DnaJ domain-containing protein [Streptomyces sp. SID5464]SOR84231.1 Chaperone protein DnaJ [Streptomyces chartreusis NRRL 3882]